MRTRQRLLYGLILPMIVMAAVLFIIMLADTRAGAAEFAPLGILLGAITVTPVVVLVNLVIVFQSADTPMTCFKRGMLAPGLVLIGALAYQTGLWDALT